MLTNQERRVLSAICVGFALVVLIVLMRIGDPGMPNCPKGRPHVTRCAP